jgi:hypothetical protein
MHGPLGPQRSGHNGTEPDSQGFLALSPMLKIVMRATAIVGTLLMLAITGMAGVRPF